jgi:hypothetical protein
VGKSSPGVPQYSGNKAHREFYGLIGWNSLIKKKRNYTELPRVGRGNHGNVVQGIHPFSGQFVNGISFRCSRWNPAQKAPVYSESNRCIEDRCTGLGEFSGTSQDTFFCPSGKVGKAFRGKHGIYIDSTRFVCDFWNK